MIMLYNVFAELHAKAISGTNTSEEQRLPKKVTERRLNWYGHVMRRGEEHILRKRKRGRPKLRWKDACQ